MKKKDVANYSNENGYLFTRDVTNNKISNSVLREYVIYNNVERVAHGIYISDDVIPDYYYILSIKNEKIVFSLESSLYLNDLMEREPELMTVMVPRGYNASHLRKKGVRVITKEKELFELGVTSIKTHLGNIARTYDLDKSICDAIKYKDKLDIQVFTYAIKEYIKRNDKNLINLIKYSKIMKIEDKVRRYLEVLLWCLIVN